MSASTTAMREALQAVLEFFGPSERYEKDLIRGLRPLIEQCEAALALDGNGDGNGVSEVQSTLKNWCWYHDDRGRPIKLVTPTEVWNSDDSFHARFVKPEDAAAYLSWYNKSHAEQR